MVDQPDGSGSGDGGPGPANDEAEPDAAEEPGGSSGAVVEQLSADAAFELLSNETRLGVLRALFDAGEPLGFSALNDAVGTRDSGQFNYHLDKLVGAFVRKTDEGYELTAEGTHVVGSTLAGPYTKTVEADPVPVDADCPTCGASLAGFFDDDRARVSCVDCGHNVIKLPVPPGTFEYYPREEWPFVAERWVRRVFETVDEGFCSVCHGPTRRTVETDPSAVHDDFDVVVIYTCERCGQERTANVEASLLWHPSVVAFYHDRGVDVRSTPVWEFEWASRPTATVVSEDPLRIEVPVEHEGERLILTLDGDATVVDERHE